MKARSRTRAGSPQGLLPGAPTDPDVHVDASGSSRCGIAVPHTTRSFRGNTLVRHGVLGVVPTPRPQRGTPFAPRGPEGRSPASALLWGAATSCRPSHRASFPSLGDTMRCVPCLSPTAQDLAADQPGVFSPVLQPAFTNGDDRISQVPVKPVDHSPCSSDPGVTWHACGSRCS